MTQERAASSSTHPLDPEPVSSLSRRRFVGLAAGTAFVVGFYAPHRAGRAAERAIFAPNAFIRVDRQGNVTLIMPQVEMGQGTYTSISMILAEELDADWSRVRTEHAPPDEKDYANPDLTIQATGNSNSVRAWWKPLRQAGANTRACFVEAAARGWGVPPAECRTENGTVLHDRSGR
jgi:isoquinoline 1-oxidoreductase beta subunit